MKIILLLSFFIAFSANAQLEGLGPIEKIIFHFQFGRAPGKTESIDEFNKKTPGICLQEYVKTKKMWFEKYKKIEGVIAEEGHFKSYEGETFTKEQMETMPNEHVLKIKQAVRGTDFLKYEHIMSGIPYPHTHPRCIDYFKEEVQKIKVGDKACRRVIFRVPSFEAESYSQVYCEGSNKLYFSFDEKMEITPESLLGKSNDCVECGKGNGSSFLIRP